MPTPEDGKAEDEASEGQSAEDRVYHRIRAAIAKRYIGPGRKLVEETLARQLNVSRTPVRAAVRRLVHEGLVRLVPRRGAYVVEPTRKEIEDAFAVRIELEEMAARAAARFCTPADIDHLRGLVEEEARVFSRRLVDDYYRANDAIHLKIAELSQNQTLYDFVADVLSRVDIYLILFDPFMTISLNPSMDQHQAVIKALRRHDSAAAAQAIREHLESTLANLELRRVGGRYPTDYLNV